MAVIGREAIDFRIMATPLQGRNNVVVSVSVGAGLRVDPSMGIAGWGPSESAIELQLDTESMSMSLSLPTILESSSVDDPLSGPGTQTSSPRGRGWRSGIHFRLPHA